MFASRADFRMYLIVSSDTDLLEYNIWKEKYRRCDQIEYYVDDQNRFSKMLGACVTPEVIIWDNVLRQKKYQGLIDDTYVALGKRKSHRITPYLLLAMQQISESKPVEFPTTKAIGCSINH
jgi:hypothetical protein